MMVFIIGIRKVITTLKPLQKIKDVIILKKENDIAVNNENELIGVENIYQDIRNKIILARERMLKDRKSVV